MAYQQSHSSTDKPEDKYTSKNINDLIDNKIIGSVSSQSNIRRKRREIITDNAILMHCLDAYVSGCTTGVKDVLLIPTIQALSYHVTQLTRFTRSNQFK